MPESNLSYGNWKLLEQIAKGDHITTIPLTLYNSVFVQPLNLLLVCSLDQGGDKVIASANGWAVTPKGQIELKKTCRSMPTSQPKENPLYQPFQLCIGEHR